MNIIPSKEARYRIAIDVYDPIGSERVAEPVDVTLHFTVFQPVKNGIIIVGEDGVVVQSQIVAGSEARPGRLAYASLCFLADLPKGIGYRRYYALLGDQPMEAQQEGIRQLPTQLVDGFRRLDTGSYILELCRGTAKGDGGSKWGIRHFEHKDQAINLIAGNKNAFGGVYGPFFTPENGMVNPPAHAIAEIETITEGPVKCQYRMRIETPKGLLPELAGKTIEIWWTFFHRSHWFVRSYFVDDYETVIDGRMVRNRITVGDEIESGKGNLMLSTYRHHDGTRYRAGDLYAACRICTQIKFINPVTGAETYTISV